MSFCSLFALIYLKGQAIGANAAFLPKPMQAKFSKLFDDAPQIPYSTILSVFHSEFGRPPSGPNGVFEVFEEKAVASASIAQVHKAKMWPVQGEKEGRWVAVKIQKPDVAKQTYWDLKTYAFVMWMFERYAFDLPVYFVVGTKSIVACIILFAFNQPVHRLRFGPSSPRIGFHQ